MFIFMVLQYLGQCILWILKPYATERAKRKLEDIALEKKSVLFGVNFHFDYFKIYFSFTNGEKIFGIGRNISSCMKLQYSSCE